MGYTNKLNWIEFPFQPSTLPQGTVNLNLCTDVVDAEPRTGQRNALCVVTPEQEIFIRGDNKEIINGSVWNGGDVPIAASKTGSLRPMTRLSVSTRWTEQLAVYPRANQQNQKKKRKAELVANQVAKHTSIES